MLVHDDGVVVPGTGPRSTGTGSATIPHDLDAARRLAERSRTAIRLGVFYRDDASPAMTRLRRVPPRTAAERVGPHRTRSSTAMPSDDRIPAAVQALARPIARNSAPRRRRADQARACLDAHGAAPASRSERAGGGARDDSPTGVIDTAAFAALFAETPRLAGAAVAAVRRAADELLARCVAQRRRAVLPAGTAGAWPWPRRSARRYAGAGRAFGAALHGRAVARRPVSRRRSRSAADRAAVRRVDRSRTPAGAAAGGGSRRRRSAGRRTRRVRSTAE